MRKFIKYMVLLMVLTGCEPSAIIVEGKVDSSKEIGQDTTEYFIKTTSHQIPYYILRTNKNNLLEGSKITLELPPSSVAQFIN
jgi:hypothetical protein